MSKRLVSKLLFVTAEVWNTTGSTIVLLSLVYVKSRPAHVDWTMGPKWPNFRLLCHQPRLLVAHWHQIYSAGWPSAHCVLLSSWGFTGDLMHVPHAGLPGRIVVWMATLLTKAREYICSPSLLINVHSCWLVKGILKCTYNCVQIAWLVLTS